MVALLFAGKTTAQFALAREQFALYFEAEGLRVNHMDCTVLNTWVSFVLATFLMRDDF